MYIISIGGAFRCYMEERGYTATSIVKPRPYQYPAARWFLNTGGNIPVTSRRISHSR